METLFIYYPKNDIRVIDYGEITHLSSVFKHNQKSYLVDVWSNKKYEKQYMRLILDLKNKNTIAYLISLSAFKKFDKGKCKDIVSKKVSRKIFNLIGANEYDQIKLEKYNRELPKNRSPIIYFIFLH